MYQKVENKGCLFKYQNAYVPLFAYKPSKRKFQLRRFVRLRKRIGTCLGVWLRRRKTSADYDLTITYISTHFLFQSPKRHPKSHMKRDKICTKNIIQKSPEVLLKQTYNRFTEANGDEITQKHKTKP